jgi:hypothetical protein
MKTKITKDSLLKFGMIDTGDCFDLLEKDLISDKWKEENPEEAENAILSLVITNERNSAELGLRTADGIIFLAIDSIEDLEIFEKAIGSYSSNY